MYLGVGKGVIALSLAYRAFFVDFFGFLKSHPADLDSVERSSESCHHVGRCIDTVYAALANCYKSTFNADDFALVLKRFSFESCVLGVCVCVCLDS